MFTESTHIPELDTLLGGGIPRGSIVLLRGGPGTGKTTLAAQIMALAARENITSSYICIEESPHTALDRLDWSFPALGIRDCLGRELIDPVPLTEILPEDPTKSPLSFDTLRQKIQHYSSASNLIVLDSLSALVDACVNAHPSPLSPRHIVLSIVNTILRLRSDLERLGTILLLIGR
jgi:circadian clock protein KaiC